MGRQPSFADGHLLLADIYVQTGEREKAEGVYRRAIEGNALSPRDRESRAAEHFSRELGTAMVRLTK